MLNSVLSSIILYTEVSIHCYLSMKYLRNWRHKSLIQIEDLEDRKLFLNILYNIRIKYTLSIVARCSLTEPILRNQFEIVIFLRTGYSLKNQFNSQKKVPGLRFELRFWLTDLKAAALPTVLSHHCVLTKVLLSPMIQGCNFSKLDSFICAIKIEIWYKKEVFKRCNLSYLVDKVLSNNQFSSLNFWCMN